MRVVEDRRATVERSHRSKAMWKKCKKGGGSERTMFLERDAAVVQELACREQEEAEGARAPAELTRLERSTPVVLCPKQYAIDVARIQKELDAEDHGIAKPSWGEKSIAARANTYERGNVASRTSVEASITQPQATRTAVCNRKKARKAVAAQMRDYAFQNRAPDPLSGDGRLWSAVIDRILRDPELRHWLLGSQ